MAITYINEDVTEPDRLVIISTSAAAVTVPPCLRSFVLFDSNAASGGITVTFPATPVEGQEIVCKDVGNNASVRNITISATVTTPDAITIAVNGGTGRYVFSKSLNKFTKVG
jgi:hypothetical protein